MKKFRISILILVILSMACFVPACGDGNGNGTPPATTQSPEDVVITIGNHTDKTGVASNALKYIDMAIKDSIRYYNENNLIPGVRVKLIEYDGQADPSRDITGYKWLKERGADVVTAWFPAVATTLRPFINSDGIPLFGTIVGKEIMYPPGYLFLTNTLLENTAWTMIKWLAGNHWDYESNGPARIGGVCWETDDCGAYFGAIKQYAELHPEQIEWVSGHIVPVSTFQWTHEVEALKDCDYIWVPNIMGTFVKAYKDAGYSAVFLGSDNQLAFWRLIGDMRIWDELDGTLFISTSEWWDDEGELIDLIKELVEKYHPNSVEEIRSAGKSYIAVGNAFMVLEIIKSAAETVGPENLDSEAIYQAAQSFTMTIDGLDRYSFTEEKRTAVDYLVIYEADGEAGDLVRISDWMPVESPP